MSARYGSRTRSGDAVSDLGRRGGGGVSLGEVVITGSPSPAVSSSPSTFAGNEFMVLNVTGNTTLTVSGPATAYGEIMLVAGGGGGGSGTSGYQHGGGGGGGVITGTVALAPGTYPIVIGGGGSGGPSPSNGTDSTAFSLTAVGGGAGGSNTSGSPGGSGGGAAYRFSPNTSSKHDAGTGTTNQGWPGKSSSVPLSWAGGGGGAGGGHGSTLPNPIPGLDLQKLYFGAGGDGIRAVLAKGSTPPSWAYYGGGGGGSAGGYGYGGIGGGGTGADPAAATNGSTNTGGGGGGGKAPSPTTANGGSGGSGRLIIRYQRFQA